MPQNESHEQTQLRHKSRRKVALWTTGQPEALPEVTGHKKIKRLLFTLAFFKLVKP
jgi:hypothetical protein